MIPSNSAERNGGLKRSAVSWSFENVSKYRFVVGGLIKINLVSLDKASESDRSIGIATYNSQLIAVLKINKYFLPFTNSDQPISDTIIDPFLDVEI